MKEYPNYRVSVEILLERDHKIFLAKRADDCHVAPGKWNVPAGKVKYTEVPTHAVIREAKEETGLDVEIIKEVGVRAYSFELDGKEAYRLVYTYLVKNLNQGTEPVLDEEHSCGEWVSLENLDHEKYHSMDPNLKNYIKNVLLESEKNGEK